MTDGLNKSSARRLMCLLEELAVVEGVVSAIPKDRDEDDNGCTLEHYAEQITDVEAELKDFRTCLLDVDLVPEHPIMHTEHEIEGTFFSIFCGHQEETSCLD